MQLLRPRIASFKLVGRVRPTFLNRGVAYAAASSYRGLSVRQRLEVRQTKPDRCARRCCAVGKFQRSEQGQARAALASSPSANPSPPMHAVSSDRIAAFGVLPYSPSTRGGWQSLCHLQLSR